jgi:hypothetical protein
LGKTLFGQRLLTFLEKPTLEKTIKDTVEIKGDLVVLCRHGARTLDVNSVSAISFVYSCTVTFVCITSIKAEKSAFSLAGLFWFFIYSLTTSRLAPHKVDSFLSGVAVEA